ncbi:hypothetical protein [Cohnella lupini]|uniref:Uncharacterized protein n=1 Tax=Cohnella lupini TaxID=1294267 RepID=A0A3D9IQ47_9BACL|nr:hypothetical protein [Cohnella lupini]RED63891.1 hypothetical protein DFP95_103132 [Cohnella lupini]
MTKPSVSFVPSASPRRKAGEVHSLLEALISKREQEISEIEQMVERYERRLRLEEQAYRSMSTLRRMLTGKKPDHHLALEYIHYVKKPMEKARTLRLEIANYREMLNGSIPTELPEMLV